MIDPILLRLIEVSKALKPGKRKKLLISSEEKHLIRFCLKDWCNQLIQENNLGGMDVVSDITLKFTMYNTKAVAPAAAFVL